MSAVEETILNFSSIELKIIFNPQQGQEGTLTQQKANLLEMFSSFEKTKL